MNIDVKINKRTILPLCIMIILILSEIFMYKLEMLRYSDEVIAIFFAIYILIKLIKRKIKFFGNIKYISISCVIVTVIGLLSNIIWKIQPKVFAILVDLLSNFKLIVCCIGFYFMISEDSAKEITKILYKPAKYMIIIGFMFSIISLFFDIGMRGQYRFGIYGFNFIYQYAHIYSMMIIFFTLIIFLNDTSFSNTKKYLIFAMVQMILTTKGPSTIWPFAVIILLIYMKNKTKISIKLISILFIITVVFGMYQIQNYFMKDNAPRAVLYRYSITTSNRYAPLGSGFATFGSDMAAKYYSPLYEEYGFNNRYGMRKNEILFLNDNYWPLVLAQFGWFGLLCFLFIIYKFFDIIQNMKLRRNIKAIIFSAYFYVILLSVGSTVFTTSATIILFLGIMIAFKVAKGEEELIMKDSEKPIFETIKTAYKKGDIIQKTFCLFLMKTGYSNSDLQVLEVRNRKYLTLEKKNKEYIKNIEYHENKKKDKTNENIWILWLQGIEQAPDIVKRCVESIKNYMKDKKIKIVSLENLSDYIQLPEFIMQKWKKGIITDTHLSDIIRTELLIKYGGTWIDATTYLTAPIPAYVYDGNNFMFRCKYRGDRTIIYNSWLIYAEKDNRLLKITRDLLYNYWQKKNKLKEYFLWHFFMTMAIKKYPKDVEKIPYFSDEMAHMLQYALLRKYDNKYWDEIKKITTIHKLTYKLDLPDDISDTYYEHIMKNKVDNCNE